MTNPYYNPNVANFVKGLVARGEHVSDEFSRILSAFAMLPNPSVLASLEAGSTLNYTWLAWADSADGTANFSNSDPTSRDYIGIAVNKGTNTRSTNPADYEWVRVRGLDGTDGSDGSDGAAGSDGADGQDGEYTDLRFIRSRSQPTRPGATDDPPAGSSNDIPEGTITLWATQARRLSSDDSFLSAWTAYERLSGFNTPTSYDASETYYEYEVVLYNGGTYIRTGDGATTGEAPSGTAQGNGYWDVLAAPGEEGDPATPASAFTATIDLTSATTLTNLRTIADAAGYTGKSDATITFRVPNTVTLQGAAGGRAIDTGIWPSSTYTIAIDLVVQNGGKVWAGGGGGGTAGVYDYDGTAGGNGGDAVYLREDMDVTIDVGGEVKAGGGGGGGGGGGLAGTYYEPVFYEGGGGGGGFPNGAAGTGFADGSAGTVSGGGAGGAGENAPSFGGNGGTGGGAATAGSNGVIGNGSSGGSGGAAGYAVRKNGYTSTVTNNGTMSGTAA